MTTGTKTKTKTNRTNQACTEIGEGHESKGGEEKSASWDLCHKKGRQAEKQIDPVSGMLFVNVNHH